MNSKLDSKVYVSHYMRVVETRNQEDWAETVGSQATNYN